MTCTIKNMCILFETKYIYLCCRKAKLSRTDVVFVLFSRRILSWRKKTHFKFLTHQVSVETIPKDPSFNHSKKMLVFLTLQNFCSVTKNLSLEHLMCAENYQNIWKVRGTFKPSLINNLWIINMTFPHHKWNITHQFSEYIL